MEKPPRVSVLAVMTSPGHAHVGPSTANSTCAAAHKDAAGESVQQNLIGN